VKIGLVGHPGSGKSTVFGALTGLPVETGYGASKENLGVVKVPDPRVDALAALFSPKKTTYAEVVFSDPPGAHGEGIDRAALNAMRSMDTLCQVLRGFPDVAGEAADPLGELIGLETETILADLEVIEGRVDRLARDHSDPREQALLERIQAELEAERPIRAQPLAEEERSVLSGYSLLSQKPLLLVLNVAEDAVAEPPPTAIAEAARERGLGLVVLSAPVEMDIAQLEPGDQQEFVESLGLGEPASNRFIRAAFELQGLISMLTAGPDECRAWPIPRDTRAPRAAGKIHSDIERGFIRAEVIRYQDLIAQGSEASCKEAGLLRIEGKDYVIQDGDVVNFRFNV
jgi:GTP-binding protein YchF